MRIGTRYLLKPFRSFRFTQIDIAIRIESRFLTERCKGLLDLHQIGRVLDRLPVLEPLPSTR